MRWLRTSVSWSLAVVAPLLAVASVFAQTVAEEDGHIWFTDRAGKRIELTTSERDCCPAVSPDGEKVVFVRKTEGKIVRVGWGETEANEIWIVSVKDRKPRMLVTGSQKDSLAQLGSPQFSPDGDRVYFMGAQAAVSGAVGVLDLASGRTKILCGGHNVEVVPRGEYRGNLIVQKHKYFVGGGSYDWYWLLKPDGEEVGPLGDDPSFFKQSWLEAEGPVTPSPEPPRSATP